MAFGSNNAQSVTRKELEELTTTVNNAASDAADAAAAAEAAKEVVQKLVNKITVPTQSGSPIYSGSVINATFNGYDEEVMTIGGTTSGTNAGTYNATFTPKEGNYWVDGTNETKTVPWIIGRQSMDVPVQSSIPTYTGNTITPTFTGYNSNKMTIGGDVDGVQAKTYSATFTPNSNYKWPDESTTAKSVSWVINKAAGSLTIDKSTMSLDANTMSGVVNIVKAGDGAISVESSDTSIASVSLSGTQATITALNSGTAMITFKVAAGTNHTAPANKTCAVTVSLSEIFGVMWDKSNQSTALTRLTTSNDPNGLVTVNITSEPTPAVGTGSGSSPFDSYLPWKGMREVNIDGSNIIEKGASGFSRTSKDTMVYIPEFWYKIVESNNKQYRYIANAAVDGFTKHPGSGKYVGRYNTISGNYSKSGAAPLVSITRATARTGATAKGSKWSQYDVASWNAVTFLYLVEFADWDSQSKVGRGYVDGNSAAINTGGTDAMTYHTGRPAGTDGKTAVQYRWIENPWGNVYEWIDGQNENERKVYICTDYTKYADDTSSNYTDTGVTLPSSGWIKDLGLSSNVPWAFLPNTNGGSETTYISDYVNSSTGWRVLSVGGYWNYASNAGLFYFYASDASSRAYTYIGARLLYHP